jgi:hypothetical protein
MDNLSFVTLMSGSAWTVIVTSERKQIDRIEKIVFIMGPSMSFRPQKDGVLPL